MAMYRIVPLGALTTGFELRDEADRPAATFRGSAWLGSGQVFVGTEQHDLRREAARTYRVDGPAGAVALARRTSPWSGRWAVVSGPTRYELRRVRAVRRKWELRLNGRPVGLIEPTHGVLNPGTADLPADLPLPAGVLVVAVVLTLWRNAD